MNGQTTLTLAGRNYLVTIAIGLRDITVSHQVLIDSIDRQHPPVEHIVYASQDGSNSKSAQFSLGSVGDWQMLQRCGPHVEVTLVQEQSSIIEKGR